MAADRADISAASGRERRYAQQQRGWPPSTTTTMWINSQQVHKIKAKTRVDSNDRLVLDVTCTAIVRLTEIHSDLPSSRSSSSALSLSFSSLSSMDLFRYLAESLEARAVEYVIAEFVSTASTPAFGSTPLAGAVVASFLPRR